MTAMLNLKLALNDVIERAREVATEYLGDTYDATLVLHTGDGDPEDSIVVSTGDKASAIPSLTAVASGSEDMEEV